MIALRVSASASVVRQRECHRSVGTVSRPRLTSVASSRSAPCSAPRRSLVVVEAGAPSTSGATAASDPLVESIMTRSPIVFQDTMPVKEAARIMVEKGYSGAPVVDSNGKLVGVLSESDLIWKGAGAPQDHWILPPVFIGAIDAYVFLRDNKQFEDEVHKILAKTVGEAMTSKPVSIGPSAKLAEATAVMLKNKVNRLPVVDSDNRVVGVLTRHDVLAGLLANKSPLL